MSLPCVAEFWSIVTHPQAERRPSTAAEASAFLEALVREGGAQIWLPEAGRVGVTSMPGVVLILDTTPRG